MFKLQHQFNNITETSQTTQLTIDQMPKFHCHSECSKCPPTAPSSNTSLQSLNLRSSNSDNLVIIYKQNKLLFVKASL